MPTDETLHTSLLSIRHARLAVLSAFLASVVASGLEILQVFRVWDTCDYGGPAAGLFLFVSAPPVLVVVQTVAVAIIALALLALAWSRSSTATLAVVAVFVSVAAFGAFAWMFFVYSGFPVQTEICQSPQPSWWRDW